MRAALLTLVLGLALGALSGYEAFHPRTPDYGCEVSLSPANPMVDARLIGECKITIRSRP
jgi:hypothetical protein